ncbi:guanylate kinase [bacterium Unc6]|nr:guanylate kinase [bacterium Unc6]
MGTGIVFILSAPSGCGKTTLIKKLVREIENIDVSVSATTRTPRPTEKDGKDYYFLGPPDFKKKIRKNEFIEWAQVFGDFYGTPKKQLLKKIKEGVDVILSLDIQGTKNLKSIIKNCVTIFLFPPSIDELYNRLSKRNMDSNLSVQKRLQEARKELKTAKQYEYWIVNDNIKSAYQKLKSIIIAERCKKRYERRYGICNSRAFNR